MITYHGLYAALSERWRAAGLSSPKVTVAAADQPALDAWFTLGFGRSQIFSRRDTNAVVHGEPSLLLSFRQATPDDEAEVIALIEGLFRTCNNPPIHQPILPATRPHLHGHVRELLADPGCATWLALHDGRVRGLRICETPTAARWHLAPINAPERSLYLFMAATAPEARSRGVGAALFDRSMRWARTAGFDGCTRHVHPASRAAFFWQGLGFVPLLYDLRRTLDPRVIPAAQPAA